MTNRRKNIRGIKIDRVNIFMLSLSCVIFFFISIATIRISVKYNSLLAITDSYISCEKEASLVSEGSDYLTEQVRLYVMTYDKKYAENYFTEINVTKRRDSALENLVVLNTDREALSFLQAALDCSNKLAESEIYAMKLITSALGYDETSFPKEIQDEVLSEDDKLLSSDEKIEKARDMVFNASYRESKAMISNNTSYFLNSIMDITDKSRQDAIENFRFLLGMQGILLTVMFITSVITSCLIIHLIVKPLRVYINCIKEDKRMDITGSYEFKYLALTYNNIFEINSNNRDILQHEAEHDHLTGLMNRNAFDKICESLTESTPSFAFLIIDIDNFKTVNDDNGHEIGDKILQKVSRLILSEFRNSDFTFRFGGDEFAVIMTEISPVFKATVIRKIDKMNTFLQNPTDGLPKTSVSVGAAFSDIGFHNNLYKEADSALYTVKENGRCGCSIYEEV
jgi:diguanylate cyclase (GGDEF)-like protein